MTNEKLKEIKERLLEENDKRRRMEQEQANACANYYERGVNDALTAVSFARPEQSQPAVDVPVVHGYWTLERDPDGGNKPVCYHCSVCDSDGCHTSIRIAYKYCPNCGAKMDGEELQNNE